MKMHKLGNKSVHQISLRTPFWIKILEPAKMTLLSGNLSCIDISRYVTCTAIKKKSQSLKFVLNKEFRKKIR